MKLVLLIFAAFLSVNAASKAFADDANSGPTVVMKATLKQSGEDALKSTRETVDATKLALSALDAKLKDASQKTTQAIQKLIQDAEQSAMLTDEKITAANKATLNDATDLMAKADAAAKLSVAAAKQANAKAAAWVDVSAKSNGDALREAAADLKIAVTKSSAAAVNAADAAAAAAKETWNKL